MIWICILKPYPFLANRKRWQKQGMLMIKGGLISVRVNTYCCQEKMATTRHTSDLREGGGMVVVSIN